MELKLVSFNVNGIRSIRDYYAQSKLNNNLSFKDFLNSFHADIICFQEHKTNVPGKLSHDLSFPAGYLSFYAFPRIPKKVGHSGVVTFVKESSPWVPVAWYDGFTGFNNKSSCSINKKTIDQNISSSSTKIPLYNSPLLEANFTETELMELDSEGRCIITDHFHFLLLNIYFPNDSGPDRESFRIKFYKAVRFRCLDLIKEHGKSLIILGDINIAYHPLDHCEYATDFKNQFHVDVYDDVKKLLNLSQEHQLLKDFYSNPMRKWLAEITSFDSEAWRDCYRTVNPFKLNHEKYTCWNTQISARGTNYGSRIDAIFTSGLLFKNIFDYENNKHDNETLPVLLKFSDILPKVMGSDHCPVTATFFFPESFKEINENVLAECKLTKGNIAKNFGKLDSFFMVSESTQTNEKNDDISAEVEANNLANIVEKEKVRTFKKNKISDFFKSSRAHIEEEEIEIDISSSVNANQCLLTSTTIFGDQFQPIPNCPIHNEPCKSFRVNKFGVNRGKKFYTCARPVGAKDDPEGKCDFFQWVGGVNVNTKLNNSNDSDNDNDNDKDKDKDKDKDNDKNNKRNKRRI